MEMLPSLLLNYDSMRIVPMSAHSRATLHVTIINNRFIRKSQPSLMISFYCRWR